MDDILLEVRKSVITETKALIKDLETSQIHNATLDWKHTCADSKVIRNLKAYVVRKEFELEKHRGVK